MAKHGNSLDNDNPHHLYEIYDQEENDILKYGISDDPVDNDGLSDRLRNQLGLFNRVVGYIRFIGKILIDNIPGRRKARQIEKEHIEQYHKKHGRRPRGNLR